MMDPNSGTPIIILKDVGSETMLPIWVGAYEANAIALEIEKIAPPRPMTHDLLRNLLHELGAQLVRVVIADLRESTFYAYLELRRGEETLFVDARPSDALALSLRTKAPIFVDNLVLESAKSVDVSSDQVDRERLQRWLESLDPDDLGYKM